MNANIYIQDQPFIITENDNKYVKATIFDSEQLETINNLISLGYIPHHTSVGVGKLDRALWRIENYKGRFGEGIKMITRSYHSHNFNHLTYFIQTA